MQKYGGTKRKRIIKLPGPRPIGRVRFPRLVMFNFDILKDEPLKKSKSKEVSGKMEFEVCSECVTPELYPSKGSLK